MKRAQNIFFSFRNQLILLSLFIIPIFPAVSAPGGAKKGPPPVPVKVAIAEKRLLAPSSQVPGTIISRYDAKLAAEVAGVLEQVAEVGKAVSKGKVLATIEDTGARLQAAEAKAGVAREKARLQFLESEVDRLQQLANLDSAARTQLDLAMADRDVARSELEVARIRLEQAEDQLGRTRIRAPYDGVVVQRLSFQGERIDRGDVIVRFASPHQLEVQAFVTLQSINHLKQNMALRVHLEDEIVSGQVKTFVPVGDNRSRLFDLRLNIDGAQLSAGQTVRVEVPTTGAREVLAIPRDALVLRSTGISVFTVSEDNKAKRLLVRTGIASGDWIEVKGQLAAGDQVVIRGGERLRPQQLVKIINPEKGSKMSTESAKLDQKNGETQSQ